jgi:hydrogenase maturation protein HypF
MNQSTSNILRLSVVIRGAVQGVGFRPFVYRLASELKLTGWVVNSAQGVFIEAEGRKKNLDLFLLRVGREAPPRASIQSLESSFLDPAGFTSFEIRKSDTGGAKSAFLLPDIAACPDCLREILDPANRRYRYPFTNCTNCGPRFTIIRALPYDRPNTSMEKFAMCPACREEYENPSDRRFHAQPNACPVCGPKLSLWTNAGAVLSEEHEALLGAAAAIRSGRIVAVKGIGGFHLMADARNGEAVRLLRERKHREEKPFAIMVPSLETAKQLCRVGAPEERLLTSPEAPIVLLEQLSGRSRSSGSCIPDSSVLGSESSFRILNSEFLNFGIMLPYSPLHHLLMRELGFPVVATSGNISDEPICIDERDALRRLNGIADFFLVHNRPIVRHADDSVVRIMAGREMIQRRARGYAPLPVAVPDGGEETLLAVGGHLKNSIALKVGANAFISQHIGDLETEQSLETFRTVIRDFETLYDTQPLRIIADLHPEYLSTQYAVGTGIPVERVQHHYAHVASCMAENRLEGDVLGVAWDGTGYGPDGTIWGGEFLLTTETSYRRVAAFRSFPLPGGEKAIKEPRRTAIGILYEMFGPEILKRNDLFPVREFSEKELELLLTMIRNGVNSPRTTSAGRLFDAVASMIGLRQVLRHEGQAAMELEYLTLPALVSAGERPDRVPVTQAGAVNNYRFSVSSQKSITDDELPLNNDHPPMTSDDVSMTGDHPSMTIDWSGMMEEIIDDLSQGLSPAEISVKFHNTLAEVIVDIAKRIGQPRVALSGGCFQNRYLTERTVERLTKEGFHPYWHQRVPPNDGGIALGQIYAAVRKGTS